MTDTTHSPAPLRTGRFDFQAVLADAVLNAECPNDDCPGCLEYREALETVAALQASHARLIEVLENSIPDMGYFAGLAAREAIAAAQPFTEK